MKTTILFFLLLICTPAAFSQFGFPTGAHIAQDTTGATVTWRKITLPSGNPTSVQAWNWSTTIDMFFALNDDTTGTNVVRVFAGTNVPLPYPVWGVDHCWIKCASSTIRCFVFFEYP